MSDRLFQGIIYQMRDAIGRTIGVIDNNGSVIACSDLTKIGETRQAVKEQISYSTGEIKYDGYTYRPLLQTGRPSYIVFIEGTDVMAEKMSMILAISLNSIKSYHDDKYDKLSFIKNIIMDNVMPGDIYVKSKELKFATDVKRVVYLLKVVSAGDSAPYDIITKMMRSGSDYVLTTGEKEIVIVREFPKEVETSEIEKSAVTIADTLASEFYTKAYIGIGSIVDNIKDIARSYREAQAALEVGRVFDNDKAVVSYENLGIGRLIYQLPITLCQMYLNEVFQDGCLDQIDRETLMTIQCFFDNSLNVSETSRKMFVHRNTLVYRLDKIKKITGLDLRQFDNAITFKVALMVRSYLNSRNSQLLT